MSGASRKSRAAPRRHVGSSGFAIADARAVDSVVVRSRAPLVGRVPEREGLRFAAVSAAQGRPQAVVITGPTGIGKSRLLEEAATLASQRRLEPVVLHCAYGGATDFAPLRPLLRRWSSPEAVDEPPVPGPTLVAQADGWLQRITAEARRVPLALFLDDLHLADDGTRAVVRHLVHWCDQQPLSTGVKFLVAATSEDEEVLDLDLPPLNRADQSPLGILRLEPLADLAMVELVRQLGLGDVPRMTAEAVAQRCGGNPLTARVVTDILLSDGQLGPGSLDRHFALGEGTLRMARSPIEVIERQFEGLDEVCRNVLAVAATMDADMPAAWLGVLTAHDEEAIAACLQHAVAIGILVEGDAPVFAHPLCRERARAVLGRSDLEALHLRMAQLLIDDGRGASAEVVEHLRRSGSLAGAALVYEHALLAGRAAEQRQEWGSAARCLQLAATVGRRLATVEPRTLGALGHDAAKALRAAGEVVDARRWAERAAERFAESDDHDGFTAATLTAMRCRIWSGSFGDNVDIETVSAIAHDATIPAERRAEARLIASEAAWMVGHGVNCLLWSSAAYDEAASVRAADLCSQALASNATGHWIHLELDDSLDQLRAARDWAALADEPLSTAIAEGRLALNYWWLGAPERAQLAAEAAFAAGRHGNTPLERAIPLAAMAAIAAAQGDHERCVNAAAESELLSSLSGDHWAGSLAFPAAAASSAWHGHLSECRAQLDRWEATLPSELNGAGHLARVMTDLHRRHVDVLGGDEDPQWLLDLAPPPFSESTAFRMIGSATFFGLLLESSARLGLTEVASLLLPYLEDVCNAGQLVTTGWPMLIPRLAATAARLAGELGRAEAHAELAMRVARSGGLVLEEGRTHVELARNRLALGRERESVAHLQAAHRITRDEGFEILAHDLESVY